ncbi:MAG: endolytic transglycosylase MltG [Rickettsiales bacterium]
MTVRKVFVLCAIFFFIYIFIPGPSNQDNKLFIQKGSRMMIADSLKNNDIIRDKYSFWVLAQLLRIFGPMQSGEYIFDARDSLFSVLKTIQLARVAEYSITFPEGLYTSEILEIILNDKNLKGLVDKTYKEGSLMPSTYHFNFGHTRSALLERMFINMSDYLNNAWLKRDKNLLLTNKQQALILASIVEKETQFDEERARVAAVFYNRLKKGMRLQSDPTTIYAITKGKYVLKQPLTKKNLKIKSAFNTYYTYGLPPQPICNPGVASILAVMHPAHTRELYFVLGSDGRHVFANKYKDHLVNVREYRKQARAN